MMDNERSLPTPTELDVLRVLWDRPDVTARAITKVLYPSATPSDIATVQKLLQRLEAKGLVQRNRSLHVHTFAAAISRTELAGVQVEQMVENLTGGSFAPVIMHLVQSKRLRPEEIRQLREFLKRYGS
jgi:predicted transcriptional regulator